MTALCLCFGLLLVVPLSVSAATTTKVQLNVNSTGGSYVGGYDFKLWNATDGSTYYFRSDSAGTGYEADDSYQIIGGNSLEGFTPGTYDMLAAYSNKGSTNVFPASIKIEVQNSSGSSVWSQTYKAPGGVTDHPVSAPQNKGQTGTITMDETGNYRLNNVELSDSILKKGSVLVITVTNAVSSVKESFSGPIIETVELPSEAIDTASTWFDLIRFRVAPVIAGLALAACGFAFIAPTFFTYGGDTDKALTKAAKALIYTGIGFFLLLLLPTIVNFAKSLLQVFSWKP